MTKQTMVLEALRENGKLTNEELSTSLGIPNDSIRTYLTRLKAKGYIKDIGQGSREFEVLKESEPSKSDFKKDIFKQMIETYMEDFENASSIQERNSVGLMITRLIDRL